MEDSERRKAIELLKEMRSENQREDGQTNNQDTRLNWMYKGPGDLVDREEYLLGKAIDKTFEVLNSGETSDAVGRTGELSNVPKRLLEKTGDVEQVDIAKKILEDPLYAIKQKEMEARKKLLNNPVKLKQIKQMLLERSKQNSSHKTKRKKLKKNSEHELNLLILKKLKMFTDKEKKKALKKIMKSDSDSSSSESSSPDNKKNKKLKSKRKRSDEESDSSSDSTSDSEESKRVKEKKKKKRKSQPHKKKQTSTSEESSSDSSSSDYERPEKSSSKRSTKKNSRNSSSDSYSESFNSKKVSELQDKSKKNFTNSEVSHEKRGLRKRNSRERNNEKLSLERGRRNIDKRDHSLDKDSKSNRNYGLMMADGSKPEKRNRSSPDRKYQKKVETKAKLVPPPKARSLSHKEREEKLKEMMENAKLRKEDRERNLANHRKKLALEEEPKSYDDDFMRRQMLHLTSQGTMADRIKSNINNIQRSKSSMDTNFMRK